MDNTKVFYIFQTWVYSFVFVCCNMYRQYALTLFAHRMSAVGLILTQ